MYLQFDRSKMQLRVICGATEKYEPTEEVIQLYQKVMLLKEKLVKFQEKTVHPIMVEIEESVKIENEKELEDKTKV